MLIQNKNQITLFIIASCTLFSYCTAQQDKTAVFVVGAPRSGTSCVAGVLNILGVDFGDNFYATSASAFNEKGDYEDKSFDLFSRKLCNEMELNPQKPHFIDWRKEPKREEYKKRVKQFIKEYKTGSFGVKLPIMSYFLPLYLESIEELTYTPKIVIVTRNPYEIAQSLHARWKLSNQDAFALISQHYFNIIQYTHTYDVLVIYFDDIIHETEKVINEINRFIPDLKNYAQAKVALHEFIDAELKHHNAG